METNMNIAAYILTGLLAVAAFGSALGKLTKQAAVMETMQHVKVQPWQIPILAIIELCAVGGLALVVINHQIAMYAAIGLVLYFVGAVVAHLKAGDNIKAYFPALALALYSTAVALVLSSAF